MLYDAVVAFIAYDAVATFTDPLIPEKLAIATPVDGNAKYISADISFTAYIPAGITTLSVESYIMKFGYLVAKLCWNDHVTADVV